MWSYKIWTQSFESNMRRVIAVQDVVAHEPYKVLEYFFSDDPWTRHIVYGSSTSVGHFVRGNRSRGIQEITSVTFPDRESLTQYVENLKAKHPDLHVTPLN
ncbi:MAG: hypothetical protein K6T81_13500 [Alicyclobacillus macrosporangiidus]|uniref:hypothetical protein n=1 Tax=Alicyclobacillus macrosporangiidus TaxID=392015 RepID=UPI0026ECD18A|nr:hypothetical protein [Alicyclobacillus macrosporangiidus]MCL6599736.1 hypothetical protein [Alicyclobacillus macrosporangiidus]